MKREFYPSEAVLETLGEDTLYQPGHTVTLLPPLTIVNLLPVDLGYLIANTAYTGKLKPGKKTTLHQVSSVYFPFHVFFFLNSRPVIDEAFPYVYEKIKHFSILVNVSH